MYSNKILNFQESTTILNACTKKSVNLLKAQHTHTHTHIYIYIYIYIYTCVFVCVCVCVYVCVCSYTRFKVFIYIGWVSALLNG